MAVLVESLMGIPGVVAVARVERREATGPAPPEREPAYLLCYRGPLDAGHLRRLPFEGEVGEPGAWGRLLNGGATLAVEGSRVEVIYRDLDAVEHWVSEASEGRFEVDAVDGWLAGMPTYVLAGELAICEALAGELARPEFPAAVREAATRRWRDTAAHALEIAESFASRRRGRLRGPAGEGRERHGSGSTRRARGVGPGRGPDRSARGPRARRGDSGGDRRPAARFGARGLQDAGGAGGDRGGTGMILGTQVTSWSRPAFTS